MTPGSNPFGFSRSHLAALTLLPRSLTASHAPFSHLRRSSSLRSLLEDLRSSRTPGLRTVVLLNVARPGSPAPLLMERRVPPAFSARHPFLPVEEGISMISTEGDSMSVAEKIPVSEETYNQILDLRHPGETLDETLARLVEKVKNSGSRMISKRSWHETSS